jgi:hypothetical protein
MRIFLIFVLAFVSTILADETTELDKGWSTLCLVNRTKDVFCASKCSKKYARCSNNRQLAFGIDGDCPSNLPYCTPSLSDSKNDYCSTMPPADCSKLLDFECTSEGVFANPANCNTFFSCRVNQNEATAKDEPFIKKLFACNDNEKYNPKNKVTYCDPMTAADRNCVAVSCKGVQDGTIMQVRNLDDYVVCMKEKAFSFTCPENTQFNAMRAPISCSFVCPKIGKFPHETDETKYYDCRCSGINCSSNNNPVSCKMGQIFNPASQMCVLNLDRALKKRK